MFDAQVFIATVSENPGVYSYFDKDGNTLYIGKARNLKKRIQSYFRKSGLTPKTALMVARIARVEVQQTVTESEAILLENNLIKTKRPRYNIALRDDKSFPYIRLTEQDVFPRFSFYRGRRAQAAKYYGPYPNAAAVREMLGYLHKIFRLRQCSDAFFRNRSRPCLQYQIKRCSAPCVNRIEPQQYREDVRQAQAMLAGNARQVMDELAEKMEAASRSLDFETAARYRDRIVLLQRVREKQDHTANAKDTDVVAVAVDAEMVCFGVVSIRQGNNFGAHFEVQKNHLEQNKSQLLEAFLSQKYFDTRMPEEILLSEKIESRTSLQQLFSIENHSKVEIRQQCRAHRARWIESAQINTIEHLRRYLIEHTQFDTQFITLTQLLSLPEIPSRIECFDISHMMGEQTVGSCVVFTQQGACHSEYRRFNIDNITPGDDYAAMRQVLTRRYRRVLENDGKIPDLVIIDGGKGQLAVAAQVLEELQIKDAIALLGIAKGRARKVGLEQYHLLSPVRTIQPKPTSPAAHLVQRIRDEAHRFAIIGHRRRRAKVRSRSSLEQIDGIGEMRRRNLLRYFGGMQEIKRAGQIELARVDGISPQLAERIYHQFH